MQAFSQWILRTLGWTLSYDDPGTRRYVLIAAPHTSNWDFPLGLLAGWGMGLNANWMGKHTLFKGILGPFARALGGIPVYRDNASDVIEQMADRFAEALAEYLHQVVRRDFWGYAPDEDFSNEDLIREKYRGIRPAPGYPACPDHTEKKQLFELTQATEEIGVSLTESYAMHPGAAVSGWYFSHPESEYLTVGIIGEDQVRHYAERKEMTLREAKRWLAPNLA